MRPIQSSGPVSSPDGAKLAEDVKLRKAAHQLEGIFLGQLFQAMRATVPQDGAVPGQEMFTSMLDDMLAANAADRMSNGLGDALYRQLSGRLKGTT